MKAITMAVQVRKLNGEKSELRLLRYVHRHQGLNLYELNKKLGWKSPGKVKGVVDRLRERGLVITKEQKVNGRNTCCVFEDQISFSNIDQYELSLIKDYLKSIIES